MVLNALQVDPNKTWKGIWRWYSEEVLHCSSVDAMQTGMSLEEITQLARCNGLHTMTFRPTQSDLVLLPDNIVEHVHSDHLHDSESCCSSVASEEDTSSGHTDDDNIFLHHNTSETYIHGSDFSLFRTAVLATSRHEGLFQICNLSRKTLG